jgi:hypothetical protein
MAAMNRSLARDNKSFRTGNKARLPVDGGGAWLMLPLNTSKT